METYTTMFQHVGFYLNTVEEVQPPPLHSQLGASWWGQVEKEWQGYMKEIEVGDEFPEKSKEVLDCFQLGYLCLAKAAIKKESDEIEQTLQVLLAKPQSVQRTEEWYREMKEVLSASEFYQLFGTARARGQLVLSKCVQESSEPAPPPRTACMTMEMTPLDWGIRFEPVAKQILESRWKATITDLGRLHHPTRKGLAASPDGLITKAEEIELLGDLVEIKCPSSRSIGKAVPPNYWYQMQLQMEVTQRPLCQYCEFTFRSFTAQSPNLCEPPVSAESEKGLLYLVQHETTAQMKYLYGPLDDMEWNPVLEEGWEILERIPWYLEKVWIQPVARDEAWFQSIDPFLNEFWSDVEKARKGTFVVPESSVKKKPTVCAIVD